MAKHKFKLMRFTLAGLPELELFESTDDRDRALHVLGKDMDKIHAPTWWLGFIKLALPAMGAIAFVSWLMRVVSWHPRVESALTFFAFLITYVGLLAYLTRISARRSLREALIESGVPVCMHCGYCLRGLPAESTICPECGKAIDAAIQRIIAELSSKQSPSREQRKT